MPAQGKFLRTQSKYIGTPRSLPVNRYLSERVAVTEAQTVVPPQSLEATTPLTKPLNNIGNFLDAKFFLWLKNMVSHLMGKKFDFQKYTTIYNPANPGAPGTGVYIAQAKDGSVSNTVNISITADWATDTPESVAVANQMMGLKPDYTIHLGDTYYSGTEDEITDNYIGPGAPWYRGPSGSFSLLGNHEMYSKGEPYFHTLLPTLGVRDFTKQEYIGQNASYFCLQTEYWNVIGLDTGYNSVGLPFLLSLHADCRFDDGLFNWLTTLDLSKDTRGIIFLSHHQYYSAYDTEYHKPAEQLQALVGDKSVLWLWGHEHRFAVYGKWHSKNGINAFGRCIGNGGMPVELDETLKKEKQKNFATTAADRHLVICDKRVDINVDGVPIGYNGFAIIGLKDAKATISYYTAGPVLTNGPVLVLQEYWTVNAGVIAGDIKQFLQTPDFTTYNSQPLTNAVH